MTLPLTAADLADRVATALGSADLDAFADLLAPDVQWGPVNDFVSGCHNRQEVLAWYRAGRDRGVRAQVTEVVAGADKLLVGLRVVRNPGANGADGSAERWQVLTVRDGQVADIRGYDDRAEAATCAGLDD
jgi:ketosteroid isomerase-like protein